MFLLIPSAKTLDFESPCPAVGPGSPRFIREAARIARLLKGLDEAELADLMGISGKLAHQTAERFARWRPESGAGEARPALWAYAGDLYDGLEVRGLGSAALTFAQERLRIVSGLYGLLRPEDPIHPYRLEMAAPIKVGTVRSLTAFWRPRLTAELTRELGGRPLLNLASEEFAKAVDFEALGVPVLTPVFQEGQAGRWRVISFHAKRARGRMARFVLEGRLEDPEALRKFRGDGYAFAPEASTDRRWIFRRVQP